MPTSYILPSRSVDSAFEKDSAEDTTEGWQGEEAAASNRTAKYIDLFAFEGDASGALNSISRIFIAARVSYTTNKS